MFGVTLLAGSPAGAAPTYRSGARERSVESDETAPEPIGVDELRGQMPDLEVLLVPPLRLTLLLGA